MHWKHREWLWGEGKESANDAEGKISKGLTQFNTSEE